MMSERLEGVRKTYSTLGGLNRCSGCCLESGRVVEPLNRRSNDVLAVGEPRSTPSGTQEAEAVGCKLQKQIN